MNCFKNKPVIEGETRANTKIELETKPEPLEKLIIYNDPSTSNLKLQVFKDYLRALFNNNNFEIILRDEFFSYHLHKIDFESKAGSETIATQNLSLPTIATKLAGTKIRDIYNHEKQSEIPPLRGEVSFEEKLLNEPANAVPGIFYDAIRLNELYQLLLPHDEINRRICHICFTPRLFGTFDPGDRRYHARVILCSYPSMISTSGIIEAPAKPREYYRIKHSLLAQNITTIDDFVPDELKAKYLKYNDTRITEALKGYVVQAVFYHLFSEPFCPEPICRLYNAHWQEELMIAQLTKPEFCSYHEELISSINK